MSCLCLIAGQLEDLDDDEEEEDDDDEEEEADDEEGDGLMAGTLMWELPRLEIAGKPELNDEVGYPTVRCQHVSLLRILAVSSQRP